MAALTEEQSMLKDQAQAWASQEGAVSTFRQMRDSGNINGYADTTWQQIIEMGWTGILVPESHGGADLGYLTMGIVLEETGRQLTASPLFAASVLGASALNLGGNTQLQQQLLPGIVDGSCLPTLAVDDGPRHRPQAITLEAKSTGQGYQLNGTKHRVVDGLGATHLVVAARTSGSEHDRNGASLFVVDADAPGISRHPLALADSRGYARIDFADTPVSQGQMLGEVGAGAELLDALLDRACAALSMEMLGCAAQSFDMTLDYLKTRVQFGQVIGSFQALGHRAAELFTQMELARSCAEGALQAIDAKADDVSSLCSLAKCKVGDFLHHMSNEMIQIHGGIGMTDEFDAGLYLKRARALESLFGNQAYHRDRYARLLDF